MWLLLQSKWHHSHMKEAATDLEESKGLQTYKKLPYKNLKGWKPQSPKYGLVEAEC